ncbi:MAG: hypothetical protein ACKO0M_03750 [Cyanobium sp.]
MPLSFFRPRERTDPAAWTQLLAVFIERGVLVSSEHPRCREPDLYGLYVRGSRTVVVCERGDRSSTLRHEGWHLVQSLCLQGKPWLTPQDVASRLTPSDRRELQVLVQPERLQREAEARAMAHLEVDHYIQELNSACLGRLDPRPPE